MRDEQRWLRSAVGLIVAGSLIAVGLTLWNLTIAIESRRLAVERAAQTLDELDRIAVRLDAQADTFEANAEQTRRSRARFEEAAQLLLDALEVDAEPFADTSAPTGHDHSPSGTQAEPDAPGESGGRRQDNNKP